MRFFLLARIMRIVLLSVLVLPMTDSFFSRAYAEQERVFPSEKEALRALFTSDSYVDSWFSEDFLAQVSSARVKEIVLSLNTSFGAFESVLLAGTKYEIVLERARVPTYAKLNAAGQFVQLMFESPVERSTSLAEVVERIAKLPGQTSVLVTNGADDVIAREPDKPLAVGSAFKLAILAEVQSQIRAKKLAWSNIVNLEEGKKSLPSGILQTWPEQTPFTVASLAGFMISQSDNTATDHLLHLVGRENVEKHSPRNRPFLSTREMFILKSKGNQELLNEYRKGNATQRRALFKKLQSTHLPGLDTISAEPTALDVEWFFTVRELCQLMGNLSDISLLGINPGVANASEFSRVGFKGGSEPGVLNLTTWVRTKAGKEHCVATTWNHSVALNNMAFFSSHKAIIGFLSKP